MARRRKCRELVAEPAPFVEQLTRSVAFHPFFELLYMLGTLKIRDRNLVRAPSALDRLAVDKFRSSPPFGGAEHDHWPTRPLHRVRRGTRHLLNLLNLRQDRIKRTGQTLMHDRGNIALHKMRFISVTAY